MYKVEVLDKAVFDLENACNYYNSKLKGLAYQFIIEFENLVKRMQQNPKQFPVVDENKRIRRALFNKFPYSVIFVFTSGICKIGAITYTGRNPKTWQKRNYD